MSQDAVQHWQRQSCCSSTSGTETTIGPHLHPYSRQPALWPDTMTVLAAAARGSPERGRPTRRCCWRGGETRGGGGVGAGARRGAAAAVAAPYVRVRWDWEEVGVVVSFFFPKAIFSLIGGRQG
jgi:hypothetical protein